MDQLTAYQILQLTPGSTVEEIKAAYAKLSKQYHPEEQPEEFQQIHEAYVTLTRGARRNGRSSAGEESYHLSEHETDSQEDAPNRYAFGQMPENVQEEPAKSYDFDQTLEKAREEETQQKHLLALQALAEMEILLSPQYRNKLKLFREFFRKDTYQEILRGPEFMLRFSQMLKNVKLKSPIYDYFIDYYRFRGAALQDMIPEAAALYQVLDERRRMHAKSKGTLASVIIPVMLGVRSGLRSSDGSVSIIEIILICAALLAIIALGVFIYRKLYENHSSIFAQAMIAVFLLVSQVIVIFTDAYAPLLGTDGGAVAAVLIFAAAGIWLIVLGIAAIITKIKNKFIA